MKRFVNLGLPMIALLLAVFGLGISRVGARIQLTQDTIFVKHSVGSSLASVGELIAADVDGDQDLDLIGAALGANKMVWWENDGTPAEGDWPQHDIGDTSNSIRRPAAGDLDGDLDIDVVVSVNLSGEIVWFENDGTPVNGGWIPHVLFSGKSFYDVAVANLDGDQDMDVVAIQNMPSGDVVWFENDGTPGDGVWPQHIIDSSQDNSYSIKPVDIDKNGDVDLLVTATDDIGYYYTTLFLYINDGEGGWDYYSLETKLETGPDIRAADAGDIDGDGDIDVVGTRDTGTGSVTWWENNGGNPATWDDWPVDSFFRAANAINLVDLDNDNDLDILGASYRDNEITWWENDGTPLDGGWIRHIIDGTFESPGFASAADIDGDGDLDVIGSEDYGGVFWWEQRSNYQIFLPLTIKQ